MKGTRVGDKQVSGDSAIKKVIDIQARMEAMRKENQALRKDRDQLLSEYNDIQHARPVPRSPMQSRKVPRAETIRAYAGDLHGMRMDKACVAAFLADMRRIDPDEIELGGDLLECGGHLAKHQPIGYVALCDYSYQEDIRATNWFLDKLQKAAPRATIEYFEGNHEHRVERWIVDMTMANRRDAELLQQVYGPKTLLRLDERGIKYFAQGTIHGEGLTRGWVKRGKMYIAHNIVEGKNAAAKAVNKASYNVTYFHTHSFDASPRVIPETGLVMAFSPGCLCEMQPMWKHSDPSEWNQGYDLDFITASGNFQRIHIPIWRGESLAVAMVERFKS